MSEFVNVTEVEILPLDKVATLIAIDAEKNIKRTSITVDQEIDADSTNPVSSKGVWEALEEFRGETGTVVDDINTELQDLNEDITDIRDEIIILNDSLDDYYTKEQTYDTQMIDFKLTEVDQKFDNYATTLYVNGLIGDINSVLDEINGEEV